MLCVYLFLSAYETMRWIGLTDQVVENRWLWHGTDKSPTFFDWGPYQPDEGKTANCGCLWYTQSYTWCDQPCSKPFAPVCEKQMFRSHQDTIQLFSKFRDFTTEDEMRLSDNLEMHGSKVMEIIDETISNIENVDYIFELLSTTGKMHNNFTGFTSNMFWRIEEPFLKAVMITLGDRYSDQMDCIYKIVIHFILEKLVDGMNSGSTDNST